MKLLNAALSSLFMLQAAFAHAIDTKITKLTFTTDDWPPFSVESQADKGVLSAVITKALATVNVKVEWVFAPGKRAVDDAIAGKVDGTFPWYKTPEREKDFEFSDVVYTNNQVFVHLKSAKFPKWHKLADLNHLKFGGKLGYSYGGEFDNLANQQKIKIERVDSDLKNIEKLLAKKIDSFAINPLSLHYLVNTEFKKNMKEVREQLQLDTKDVSHKEMYVLVGKNHPKKVEVLKLVNQGLANLHKTGELAKLTNVHP